MNLNPKNYDILRGTCILVLIGDILNFFFVSQIFLVIPKLILIFLLFKYVKSFVMISVSFFLIISTFVHSFTDENVSGIVSNIAFLLKIILFLYSMEFILTKKVKISQVSVNFVTYYFIFNIFLTWIGVGLTNYGRLASGIPIGSKGIYQSGNEFGIAFIFLALIALSRLKPNSLREVSHILIGFGIATKVSISASICVVLFRSAVILHRYKVVGLIFLLIFIFGLSSILQDLIITRFAFDYNRSANLINFLLSGRDTRIISSLAAFADGEVWSLLLGFSFSCVASQACGGVSFVENDIVDLLLIYGLIPTLIICLVIAYQLVLAWRSVSGVFSPYLCLILISMVSGHVLYNPLLPVLLLMIYRRGYKNEL